MSGPRTAHCFHGGKKYLELPDGDAVAGQHPQQLHQEVRHDLQEVSEGLQSPLELVSPAVQWAACAGDVLSDRSECRPEGSGWIFSGWQ